MSAEVNKLVIIITIPVTHRKAETGNLNEIRNFLRFVIIFAHCRPPTHFKNEYSLGDDLNLSVNTSCFQIQANITEKRNCIIIVLKIQFKSKHNSMCILFIAPSSIQNVHFVFIIRFHWNNSL